MAESSNTDNVVDKAVISQLIEGNSSRVTFSKNQAATSSAWKTFSFVNVDNVYSMHVSCNDCKILLKWKSRDGTSGLSNHAKVCPKKKELGRKISELPGFAKIPSVDDAAIPSSIKTEMADVLVKMCATDIRPFEFVSGQGFHLVADKLIEVGARYGRVPASKVIPCPTTVKRHLDGVYDKEKQALIKRLEIIGRFGVTCDLWTNSFTSASFMAITAHYTDDDFIIQSHILATRRMDESHTGENIKQFIRSVLQEFRCHRLRNVFVTDNAANMKCAFSETIWLPCAGHNLNLVLSHGMEPSKEIQSTGEEGVPGEISELIENCKHLVTIGKRTKISSRLETSLKQCVATRWNSTLTMLKSVEQNLTDLRAIASEGGQKNLLKYVASVNEETLSHLIATLEPFDHATKLISAESTPTLHLVLPIKLKLSRHLSYSANDSALIQQLKRHLLKQLNGYFTITPLHKVAALLDPRLKCNAQVLPVDDRDMAVETLRSMVNPDQADGGNDDLEDEDLDVRTPVKKKAKTEINLDEQFFGDIFGSPTHVTEGDEVDAYLAHHGTASDVLDFWKKMRTVWPQLASVARELLGVPATSTPSERTFSTCGRTMEARRNQLDGETVDGLMFLHGL